MRNWLVVSTVLVSATLAHASPEPRACILEASANLPRIPGIKIVGKPVTRPAPRPGFLLVDVRVNAAGVSEKMTYLCASDGVRTLVQRVRAD